MSGRYKPVTRDNRMGRHKKIPVSYFDKNEDDDAKLNDALIHLRVLTNELQTRMKKKEN